jgi:large subunit ribosomal protein L6
MSRIAKKPIRNTRKDRRNLRWRCYYCERSLGITFKNFRPEIEVKVENKEVTLTPVRNSLDILALWGTYASHLRNMLAGVNTPYTKKLIVEGIGFKSDVKGKDSSCSRLDSHIQSLCQFRKDSK